MFNNLNNFLHYNKVEVQNIYFKLLIINDKKNEIRAIFNKQNLLIN